MPCLWRNNQRLAMAIHDRIGLPRQRLFVGGKGRRLEMTIRGTRGPPLWSCSCSSSCCLRKSAQPWPRAEKMSGRARRSQFAPSMLILPCHKLVYML
jgi:hypothetical protein